MFGNGGGGGDRWVVGWERRRSACTGVYACVHAYVCMCTRALLGVVFAAQPWWADVMLGSGPCLCSALAVAGAATKSVVI